MRFCLCPLLASWFLSCVFSFVFLFFGIHHFCLPMPWRDFLVQGANWKRWKALAQRRQTSLRLHLSRARGVVVSHPLSMREALGSIPSVSILVPHADRNRKGKTNVLICAVGSSGQAEWAGKLGGQNGQANRAERQGGQTRRPN